MVQTMIINKRCNKCMAQSQVLMYLWHIQSCLSSSKTHLGEHSLEHVEGRLPYVVDAVIEKRPDSGYELYQDSAPVKWQHI